MYVIFESLCWTPGTNLTYATHTSLKTIIFKMESQDTKKPTEMEERVWNLEFGKFIPSKEFKEQIVFRFLR